MTLAHHSAVSILGVRSIMNVTYRICPFGGCYCKIDNEVQTIKNQAQLGAHQQEENHKSYYNVFEAWI